MDKAKASYIASFLKNAPSSVLRIRVMKKFKNTKRFLGHKGITLEYSSNVIKEYLSSDKPFGIMRIGATEMGCLNNTERIDLGLSKTYKDSVRYSMKNNAGFYPTTDAHLSEYSHTVFSKAKYIDCLGIMGLHMEDYFAKKYFPNAKYISFWATEPLLGGWTPLLKGKKVLVTTSFADEVVSQYARREKLFEGHPEILPEFDLQVLQAPMTLGDETDERFPSSMRYLEEMFEKIRTLDFDIALVGAGAYGLPLVLYIRSLGKSVIQCGGATQTLFGIIGKRWENREHVKRFINEYWIRPKSKPAGFEKIDGGAYW